jgi:hypothetical protein
MLRAGYVDVALIFRHEAEGPSGPTAAGGDAPAAKEASRSRGKGPSGKGPAGKDSGDAAHDTEATAGKPHASEDPDGKDTAPRDAAESPDGEGLREQVLLDEPVNLIMPEGPAAMSLPEIAPAVTEVWPDDLARFADYRWIAGCDRCREHLLQQCAAAGYTPKISFTTDDFVAVQALVTVGLGVALLPSLALSAARNPAVRVLRLRGTKRSVVAVRYGEPPDPPATALLMGALRAAATGSPAALPAAVPAGPSGWPGAAAVPAPAPATLG